MAGRRAILDDPSGTSRSLPAPATAWLVAVFGPLVALGPAILTFDDTHLVTPGAWFLAVTVGVHLLGHSGPSLVASVVSTLLMWFAFLDPQWSFRITDTDQLAPLTAFALLAFGFAAVLTALRSSGVRTAADLAQLDAAMSHAPIGMALLDTELLFVHANPAFADLDGAQLEAHVGRSFTEFLPGPAHLASRVLSSGVTVLDVPANVGDLRLALGLYPVRNAAGDVVGVGVIARDVTAQTETESSRAQLLGRLQRLQRITATLAAARTLDEVVRVVVMDIRRAVGATAASLLAVEGDELVMLGADGYAPGVVAMWSRFPIGPDTALGVAVNRATLLHIPSLEQLRTMWPAMAAALPPDISGRAATALPLVDHGRVTGAIGLTFDRDRAMDASEEAFLVALATQCAQALVRARLYDSEHEARQASDAAATRLSFLAEASAALTTTLDVETTIRRIVGLAVPRLADWCSVHLTSADGEHLDVDRRARSGRDPGHVLGRDLDQLVREVAVGRRGVQDHPDDADGPGRWLSLPLVAQDRTVGVLTLAVEQPRLLSPGDASLAVELGHRVAQSVLNAQLFGERAHVAHTLQASLLPPVTPTVPGLDVATRYFAVGEGIDVGGDFYDVFRLGPSAHPSGRWAVVIGDVRGKGAEAAAITGAARHALRAAGLHHESPARMLQELNEVLLVMAADANEVEARFCTAVVAVVEPGVDRSTVRLAVGGHPQPIHLRADGGTSAAGAPGDLLGVLAEPALTDVELELAPGDALVLFTDGITERHAGDRFLDEDGLAAVVSRCAGFTAAALAERVETAARAFVEEAPRDDMAVLVIRAPEARATTTASANTELPGDASAPARARQFVAAVLEGGEGREDLIEVAVLLTSELVTNAVVHAGGPVKVGLDRPGARVRVSVSDGSSVAPRLRDAAFDSESGRGIFLVDQLAHSWGVDAHAAGKTVWFELSP